MITNLSECIKHVIIQRLINVVDFGPHRDVDAGITDESRGDSVLVYEEGRRQEQNGTGGGFNRAAYREALRLSGFRYKKLGWSTILDYLYPSKFYPRLSDACANGESKIFIFLTNYKLLVELH
ncbi:hypothetical protein KGF57_003035 [Candida theae]|uniref:Uncharacterized protein n=1 Tax=Candida theae TaxID=1198502 RepID=A0AAD5BEE2_9ASCO|nr:uncharacterized protein KGF57_003035 [Candida theae]KAI5957768.1 hypothetical protein KGF57_003035 [Candida theae]